MASDLHFATTTVTRPMYTVYCANDAIRTQLLAESSEQLATASTHYQMRLATTHTSTLLDLASLQQHLQTKHYGRVLILTESPIPSTQDVLRGSPLRAPFYDGVVVLAKGQTNGRGRSGSSWYTAPGSLCFSLECRVPIDVVPFVQYVAALAITQCFPRGVTHIKWPNDVLCREHKKMAGVLCEGSVCGDVATVVVGVGVNIDAVGDVANATSLNRIGCGMGRDEVLANYLNNFETLMDRLRANGFEAVRYAYLDRWLHSGQSVYLEDEGVTGVITGIASSGSVLVTRTDGSLRELPPDVTSLDLNAGVLRRKRRRTSVMPA